jgi:hypothetical protein
VVLYSWAITIFLFADRKFIAGTSPNWSPDTCLGISATRSSCWEDGIGAAEKNANLKENQKIEKKRHIAEHYDQRIRQDVIEKETKESERRDNHR